MGGMNEDKRSIVAKALREIVEAARGGGPKLRIGLMAHGGEMPLEEYLHGACQAMSRDSRIQVVCLGPKPEKLPEGVDWIEAEPNDAAIAKAMEKAMDDGSLDGAVALHYPFPVGVTTIGRAFTPGRGRPMILASTTGISAGTRACAMLYNAVYGLAVARAAGMANPTIGIVNLDAAPQVLRALTRMAEKGYAVEFGESLRGDGGSLLRGNDLLAGSVDVAVCDTLTGNVLAKVFAAFTTGGGYEALGWGYGPSVGDGWKKVVSIISRASGAPVIAGALEYTAQAIRGKLPEQVAKELAAARAAGFEDELKGLSPKPEAGADDVPPMPKAEPCDEEIHGIDVLDLDKAVHSLWKANIYAEGAMGCTGPVVKLASANLAKAKDLLKQGGFI